jgi:hypothetical protein
MKLETMKVRSKASRKFGINIIFSKGNIYLELGLGKLTYIIGLMK